MLGANQARKTSNPSAHTWPHALFTPWFLVLDFKVGNEKDDDHHQEFVPKDMRHIWSWSFENLLLRRRRTMTMTEIPPRKTWYAHGHGPLIFHFQRGNAVRGNGTRSSGRKMAL